MSGLSLKQKIALELQRQLARDNVEKHPLRQLFWESTLRCNMKCRHCGSDCKVSSLQPDMPFEDFAKVLRRIKEKYDSHKIMIIITGGEPLMQADFLCDVLDRIEGVHRAVETSGYASEETFSRVVERTDMMLFDVKLTDPAMHKKYTGADNRPILRNLDILKLSGKDFVVRVPLIPGVNDTPENMEATSLLLAGAEGLKRVELLRYHKTAGAKYPMVGMEYSPDFDEDAVPQIYDMFTERGIKLLVL